MTRVAAAPGIAVRDATPADNAVLRALAAACPMVGDITMCTEREPDFFALTRLEGERCHVGVAGEPGDPVRGCVSVAERRVWLFGRPSPTIYAFDLKVHPDHRGSGTVDALIRFVVETGRDVGGDDIPGLITVLAGNRPMERLCEGPRGLPVLRRFATIRAHAIPLLFNREPRDTGLRITRADERDIAPMMALWQRVAPARQLAPDLDAESFAAWVAAAPGLSLHDYWIARRPSGRVAGFVGIWDQSVMKQLRVLAYSPRLAVARLAINALGRLVGGATLPRAGALLRTATAVHICVPGDEPGVLHALLRRATDDLRARGFAVCTVGLDRKDPLTAALRGFGAQPTDVNGCITTPAGRYEGPDLADRPFHYDIAMA